LDIKIDFQHTHEGSNFGHLPEQSLWLRDPDGMLLNIVVSESAGQSRDAVKLNHPERRFIALLSAGRLIAMWMRAPESWGMCSNFQRM